MTDPRRHPANGRVAALRLRGEVEAQGFTEGVPARVVVPVADLLRAPGGPRDRQFLLGEEVTSTKSATAGPSSRRRVTATPATCPPPSFRACRRRLTG